MTCSTYDENVQDSKTATQVHNMFIGGCIGKTKTVAKQKSIIIEGPNATCIIQLVVLLCSWFLVQLAHPNSDKKPVTKKI